MGMLMGSWVRFAAHGRPPEIRRISMNTGSGSFRMRRLDWSGCHLKATSGAEMPDAAAAVCS